MTGSRPIQDAGAVQKIVHQGVDGNHVSASFGPARVLAAEEQIGQRHHQDLVRHAVDVPQRPNDGLDARRFNRSFPKVFPRFVQHAVWRYCAQTGFDICNGNRIDDRQPCQNGYCRLYWRCDRKPLM
jgi:hypothetical protein